MLQIVHDTDTGQGLACDPGPALLAGPEFPVFRIKTISILHENAEFQRNLFFEILF